MSFSVQWLGTEALMEALARGAEIPLRMEAIAVKNATLFLNDIRAHAPKKSGEMRNRSAMTPEKGGAEVGLRVEYAPHVEYGHRIVRAGKTIGYVNGQYFLQDMANAHEKEFQEDVDKMIGDLL